MITKSRSEVKVSSLRPVVLFDATRHRNRHMPSFAAGVLPATRWTGEYRAERFSQEDVEWARDLFGDDGRAAELDAEEDAYNAMLEQRAWEAAAVERLTRGHAL